MTWVRRGQPRVLRNKENHEPVGPRARDYVVTGFTFQLREAA